MIRIRTKRERSQGEIKRGGELSDGAAECFPWILLLLEGVGEGVGFTDFCKLQRLVSRTIQKALAIWHCLQS